MNIPSWRLVVLAVCSAAFGAVFALAADDKPAPPAKDKPAKEDWLPKPGDNPSLRDTTNWEKLKPPTAFPELAVIQPDWNDPKVFEKRDESFAKLCPHFVGKSVITIEATDDLHRKLLKAGLHQELDYMIRLRDIIRTGSWTSQFFVGYLRGLANMEATCLELWNGQPKELVPWLEELVVVAKEFERFQAMRVTSGTMPPQYFTATYRHRLRAEATLWKAKNPK
jgi:hypothetical protein